MDETTETAGRTDSPEIIPECWECQKPCDIATADGIWHCSRCANDSREQATTKDTRAATDSYAHARSGTTTTLSRGRQTMR